MCEYGVFKSAARAMAVQNGTGSDIARRRASLAREGARVYGTGHGLRKFVVS